MPDSAAAPHADTYDHVPYESRAFVETHPDYLATQAFLFGGNPPDVARCRVLELGCATGGNLIPMAISLPEANFVGIDISPGQIARCEERVARFGLKNITFRQLDIADIGEGLGTFDYIVCHGVYSWVAPAIQDAILRTCARNLTPDGVAYVSYNVLPGWHQRGLVRELMLFHNDGVTDPAERAARSRSVLDTVLEALPKSEASYPRQLAEIAESIRHQGDDYLNHEYLEEENHPVYFANFVARASEHGLRWMTEARFRTRADQQPEGLHHPLQTLSPDDDDVIRREQYLDFLRNRAFRRALLVHDDRPISSSAGAGRIRSLQVRATGAPVSPNPSVMTDAVEEFRSADGRDVLRTGNRLAKASQMVLCSHWPHALPVESLIETLSKVPEASAGGPPLSSSIPEVLLDSYRVGLVEFTTFEPAFHDTAGVHPQASPLVLAQAEEGNRVTSLLHRMVELSEFERLVIRQLDGRRDREEILNILVACTLDGRFPLHQNGQPIVDPMAARPILSRSLEPCLKRLAMSALLIG